MSSINERNTLSNQELDTLKKQSVLIPTPYYEPAHLGGGPIRTLKALVEAAPENFEVKIVCLNHDFGTTEDLVPKSNEWVRHGKATINYTDGGLRVFYDALRLTKCVDILYLNSFFNAQFTILPIFLSITKVIKNRKILIAPRGEFDPGALKFSAAKKKIYINLFKFLHLHHKVIWHASSSLEAHHIQNVFGEHTKILVRENETSLPLMATTRAKRSTDPVTLLFASRLHEKKGLHILLGALQGISTQINLNIVGKFEDPSYAEKCRSLASALPSNFKVSFIGALPHESVLEHFRKADLFVFPTAGENFGHVIAESLSQSCPVMCSDNTPWNKVLKSGGGYVVPSLSIDEWSSELMKFLKNGNKLLEQSSLNAGESYNAWRLESKGEHIFRMIENL